MATYYNPADLVISSKQSPKDVQVIEEIGRAHLVKKEENFVPLDVKVSCLPAVVIFVHGVNTEGDWYAAAERNLCQGLNTRLGRKSIVPPTSQESAIGRPVFSFKNDTNSPVIHFWWGYKSSSDAEGKNYPGINLRKGDELQKGGYWGGGPFQNGTTSLMELWGLGMQDLLTFIDPQRINP